MVSRPAKRGGWRSADCRPPSCSNTQAGHTRWLLPWPAGLFSFLADTESHPYRLNSGEVLPVKISALQKAVAAFLLAPLLLFSQQPSQNPAALNAEAVKAYQAKDYSQFLTLEKRAMELAPDNPRYVYNAACGEALQGNAKQAVRLLDQLI